MATTTQATASEATTTTGPAAAQSSPAGVGYAAGVVAGVAVAAGALEQQGDYGATAAAVTPTKAAAVRLATAAAIITTAVAASAPTAALVAVAAGTAPGASPGASGGGEAADRRSTEAVNYQFQQTEGSDETFCRRVVSKCFHERPTAPESKLSTAAKTPWRAFDRSLMHNVQAWNGPKPHLLLLRS